jgi:hypothetical protein
LPFTDILTDTVIGQALAALSKDWLDRIFSPLVTLWVFLGQVLSADHSCRAAVARLIAHRLAQGRRPCSAATGAYCQARKRLPEEFFSEAGCLIGRALESRQAGLVAKRTTRLHVRRNDSHDADTLKTRQLIRRSTNGARFRFFPSHESGDHMLACGAIVNLGFCRHAGKGQGEVSLPPIVERTGSGTFSWRIA